MKIIKKLNKNEKKNSLDINENIPSIHLNNYNTIDNSDYNKIIKINLIKENNNSDNIVINLNDQENKKSYLFQEFHGYLPHNSHVHHVNIPHYSFYDYLEPSYTINNSSRLSLLNEINELKKIRDKYKNDLTLAENEKEISKKYIKILENKLIYNNRENRKIDNSNNYAGNININYIISEKRNNFNYNDFKNKMTMQDKNIVKNDLNINNNSYKYKNYFENKNNINEINDINKDSNINKHKENNNFTIYQLNNNNIEEINKNLNKSKTFNNIDMNYDFGNNFELINNHKKDNSYLKYYSDKTNKKEESNYFNERYLIVDENSKPIIIKGKKLLGMKLIPLIGENSKEELNENGNIILIGPDGKQKYQKELRPIILDNNKPLVNEENKPLLSLCGFTLINDEGKPVIGMDELYDKGNRIIGILGIVAKDKFGNPLKININDNVIENKQPSNYDLNTFEISTNNKTKESNIKNDINNSNKPKENTTNDNNVNNNISQIKKDNIRLIDNKKNKIIPNIRFKKNKKIKNKLFIKSQKMELKDKPNKLNIPSYHTIYSSSNNNKGKKKIVKKSSISRDKREKGRINYSECNSKSLKKINFRKNSNDIFSEYKVTCFACDVGCSVSRTGYSQMSYSPYNNIIKRREFTPIKN